MMGWQDLLSDGETRVLPWVGGRTVYERERSWFLKGSTPVEHGWYSFSTVGRKASLQGEAESEAFFPGGIRQHTGYLVGNRFIQDNAVVVLDPDKLVTQTHSVFLVELGLERCCRATVTELLGGQFVFLREEFPLGPEQDVLDAYLDRLESVDHIQNVTPALDLAFRWMTLQRHKAEERARRLALLREEEERKRLELERMAQVMQKIGTGPGRRELAAINFEEAAKAALQISGADLLDARPSRNRNEMVIQYRFEHRRLECVVEKDTLRIVDAGICLEDHNTGVKGDTLFTLESLPGVVAQAMRENNLVVWRHVPGDQHD